MSQIKCSRLLKASRQSVFEYMMLPDNWVSMLSYDINVDLNVVPETMESGNIYKMNMTRFGLSQPVEIVILEYQKNTSVTYKQVHGLFAKWIHTQSFEDTNDGCTQLTDIVEYKLPFGVLGHLLDDLLIRENMKSILQNRLQKAARAFRKTKKDSAN